MSLIDRNEAIDAIWRMDKLTYAGCIDAINALDEKIIRCRDCIWYSHNNNGDTFCDHPKGLIGWVVPTDFCSKSERKTDE